jgi:mRNA-degrading endonuclease RelE of RelBE toxin-antitoxin system
LIKFYSITRVQECISNYCKRDYGYNYCKKDLCDFFKSKSIEVIFEQPILIAPNDNFRFIKSRIENSYSCKGKSSGYRLYYYVDLKKEHVYFIGFYPKVGKYGRDDLTNTEIKILLRLFNEEKQAGTLCEYDINNELQEIISINPSSYETSAQKEKKSNG